MLTFSRISTVALLQECEVLQAEKLRTQEKLTDLLAEVDAMIEQVLKRK